MNRFVCSDPDVQATRLIEYERPVSCSTGGAPKKKALSRKDVLRVRSPNRAPSGGPAAGGAGSTKPPKPGFFPVGLDLSFSTENGKPPSPVLSSTLSLLPEPAYYSYSYRHAEQAGAVARSGTRTLSRVLRSILGDLKQRVLHEKAGLVCMSVGSVRYRISSSEGDEDVFCEISKAPLALKRRLSSSADKRTTKTHPPTPDEGVKGEIDNDIKFLRTNGNEFIGTSNIPYAKPFARNITIRGKAGVASVFDYLMSKNPLGGPKHDVDVFADTDFFYGTKTPIVFSETRKIAHVSGVTVKESYKVTAHGLFSQKSRRKLLKVLKNIKVMGNVRDKVVWNKSFQPIL